MVKSIRKLIRKKHLFEKLEYNMYAEEFILIPRKTYAPDKKKLYHNLKSLIFPQPMTNHLSSIIWNVFENEMPAATIHQQYSYSFNR